MSMLNLSADTAFESHENRRGQAALSSLAKLPKLVMAWYVVAAERRELRQADARLAQDLGRSLDDIRLEAEKPFWDLGKEARRRFGL